MKTMKGPGIFLAQFVGPDAPFNSLPTFAKWAKDKGFIGVQIPTTEKSLFDLRLAAESDAYCDEVKGILKDAGIVITELSTHLQGQLVAVHPAYDTLFDAFAPEPFHPASVRTELRPACAAECQHHRGGAVRTYTANSIAKQDMLKKIKVGDVVIGMTTPLTITAISPAR